MVELDIKIGARELYDYMLMHSYNSPAGLLGSGVGAIMIIVALSKNQWLFLIAGIVLLLYLPWTLFIRSRKQALDNPVFQQPLHYVLDEEGITISQGETSTHQAWENMVKAVSTGKSIIVYTTRVNATIFPKNQLGDKKEAVIEIISTHMSPKKVKIRN
ncbi:MAG: YcxB family protein [Lachnospiraceae bacterium]|nr:YcxB family protein [Lachnospiraceae bacterium]